MQSQKNMQHRRIAFIGAGNMSRSIISGLVNKGYPADFITASNPSTPKLDALQQDFSIKITQNNVDAIEQSEVVVLAVKPQMMEQVCGDFADKTNLNGKVFVSIAAGINLARLQEMLKGKHTVIRTMPNTPSALGKGMTGLFADSTTKQADRDFAGDLMSHVGEIAWVQEEHMIDAVIAAAGSSPAYFFLFAQAMQEEAERMGFAHSTARLLVQQAMLGAAAMICDNPQLEISELRNQVTSKGGTTAQAIAHFQEQDLAAIVSGAMQAAVTRAKQMTEQF